MGAGRARVREQAIERDDGRDVREHREEREEGDASGRRQHPVGRGRPEHSHQDVAPTTCRDVLRCVGLAATTPLVSAGTVGRESRGFRLLASVGTPVLSMVFVGHGRDIC